MKIKAPFKPAGKTILSFGLGFRGWDYYDSALSRCDNCHCLVDDGMEFCHDCYEKDFDWGGGMTFSEHASLRDK